MGDCVESLAEVQVDNIHGSPFVYPASHVIVEKKLRYPGSGLLSSRKRRSVFFGLAGF